MAAHALTPARGAGPVGRGAPGGLPAEAELQAFAHAAAHLLIERTPRLAGARTVARRPGVGIQQGLQLVPLSMADLAVAQGVDQGDQFVVGERVFGHGYGV